MDVAKNQDLHALNDQSKKNLDSGTDDSNEPVTRLYKRRFFILGIFCLYSMSSAFQWIEYAIITNIVLRYYVDSTELSVAWTSMIYMLSYIPLMFIATWMLDNWGLRRILLFGAMLNAVGSLIKIGSVGQHLFIVTFIGQTVAACAQSFILEIPPKIASVWFGPSEVSTATAVGVFGNQLGVALGFVLPPLIVPDSQDMNAVAAGFRVLFISSATACTIVVFLIFFVIRDKPPLPPSKAQAVALRAASDHKATQESSLGNYKRSIAALIKNVPFLLLFITYGINTGTYYAIGTLLNPILEKFHQNATTEIGFIGLTMVLAGLVGSVICGYFLDLTKRYKATTVSIYFFSMAFMIVFTFTIDLKLLWLDFVSIGLLGFFMTGYLPIGFEFGAEITFPESEATSSGLLNVSAQFFGILFTLIAQEMLKLPDHPKEANLFMSVALLVGTVLTALIKSDLRRQAANMSKNPIETGNDEVKVVEPYRDTEVTQQGKSCQTTVVAYNNENHSNNKSRDKSVGEGGDADNGFGDETKLIRLASASSCYSTGPQW